MDKLGRNSKIVDCNISIVRTKLGLLVGPNLRLNFGLSIQDNEFSREIWKNYKWSALSGFQKCIKMGKTSLQPFVVFN